MWRVNEVIARFFVLLSAEILGQFADHAALGVPENQARAYILTDAEEIEFSAKNTMVALLCLLKPPEILLQFLAGFPGCAVYTLKHGPLLVPTPVGAPRHLAT